MPRLPRIDVEGAIYFVTSRGSNNQEIFKDKADYTMYLELLKKYKSQHHFRLYSYMMLPDRLHLLIETGQDATISQIMHDLNSLYTKYFNSRHARSGHLFEARFKSALVEKAQYLLLMTRHMHRMSATPAQYPYSSFHVYTSHEGPVGPDMTREIDEVKAFLKTMDSQADYERFCLAGSDQDEELAKKLRRGGILGTESFNEAVKRRVEERSKALQEEAAVSRRPNQVLVMMVGAAVLVATASSAYLYISKRSVESKYLALLQQKEAEFTEKTRFENRSPLALQDLEGTDWDIEIIPANSDAGPGMIKDRIHFENGRFSSDYFSRQGYVQTRYTVTRKTNGATWETIQTLPGGHSISWRGDWQGDAMKGVTIVRPAGQSSRDYSFYSVSWALQGVLQ